jgi:hypothetical protein
LQETIIFFSKDAMNLRLALLIVSAAQFFATNALAQYVTGFESPLFVSGELNGQDTWTTSTNTATARILTASEIATELTNAGLNPDMPVHGGSQALVVSGAGAGNATIRVISGLESEMKVLLDVWTRPLTGGSTGNIFLTMEDPAGTRAAAFRFGPSFSIDYGTNIGGVWQASGNLWNSDTWYRLTMSLDYGTKTYDFSIDGTKINSSPIPFYNVGSTNFSQIRIFRGQNQSGMIVDDLLVVIPEPGAIALLFAGGSALILRRRRPRSLHRA